MSIKLPHLASIWRPLRGRNSLRTRIVLCIAMPSIALLAVLSAIVYVRVPALLGTLVGVGAALCACALFVGALLSRRIVDPIERMARKAEEVRSASSAAAPIPRDGTGDEVDRLAGTLNATFARLHESWVRQTRFTADASHELRTPLSVVRSQAEVALRRGRSPEEYREALAAVMEAAGQMEDTLEGLLLLARADARASSRRLDEPVDLRNVAQKAIGALNGTVNPKLTVRLEAPPEDGRTQVSGDSRQLEILVRNLLTNAVRHTPAGEVVVKIDAAPDGSVLLEVRDTGEGISPEALPHIFERFFRADEARNREHGGSGLGLSIVQVIVDQHGGTVSARSAPGQGTVIAVRLPHSAGA